MTPIHCSKLAAAGLACAIFLVDPGSAIASNGKMLPDSTVLDRWTLANGLTVVTRHIPRGNAVAITVGYRGGNRLDPDGREGLAALLAEAAYTGPAGEIPERSRAEMSGLRPMGWNLRVSNDYVLFSELAAVGQFPGVLHQVAVRMRSVTVTDEALRTARLTVQRDLEEKFALDINLALANQVRELAGGGSPESIARHAAGKGIEALTAKEIQKMIRERFVPANAVVSIAGNLTNVDLHRLIESEFGTIPSGAPLPDPARVAPKAGTYTMASPAARGPVGAVGIIAPALTDSLHPSFYLHVLDLGSFTKKVWKPPPTPMSSTFEYSVVDNPELAIFYPPVFDRTGVVPVSEEFRATMADLSMDPIDQEIIDQFTGAIGWLLGGPLSPTMLRRVRTESGALHTLANSTTLRELRGGDAFWAKYRARLSAAARPGMQHWAPYFIDPSNQVQLKLVPSR